MKLLIVLIFFSSFSWGKNFVPASFSAKVEESFVSKASGKEKKSLGKIDYKFPSHIRFEKLSPDPSIFVSNPDKSWYYVPAFVEGEHGQVTIQKSSRMPLTKFLDSMKNGLEGSKLFTHKYQGHDLILTFVSTIQKEVTLRQVVLHALKEAKEVQALGEFEKMTLSYVDGRMVTLKFMDLKEDVSFPANNFEFKIPAKTKITEN